MGFYYNKFIGLKPFRVNLSSRGIGYSIDVGDELRLSD